MREVIADASADEFLAQAGPLLYGNEIENSMMIGMVEALLKEESEFLLLRMQENDKTTSAAVLINSFYLCLTKSSPAQLQDLVLALKRKGVNPPGVAGPVLETETFSRLWTEATKFKAQLGMQQIIYRLEKVIHPQLVEGFFREARASDQAQLAEWFTDFSKQVLPQHEWPSPQHSQAMTRKMIAEKSLYVWEHNANLVSMINTSRATQNTITIGRVYTPEPYRKHGYALALGATLCQTMLNAGKRYCVTYVSDTNLVSKHGCIEVGFEPHAPALLMLFTGT